MPKSKISAQPEVLFSVLWCNSVQSSFQAAIAFLLVNGNPVLLSGEFFVNKVVSEECLLFLRGTEWTMLFQRKTVSKAYFMKWSISCGEAKKPHSFKFFQFKKKSKKKIAFDSMSGMLLYFVTRSLRNKVRHFRQIWHEISSLLVKKENM